MKKKLSIRRINRLYWKLTIGGILIMFLSLPFQETIVWIGWVMMIIGALMLGVADILWVKFYRCPECDEIFMMSDSVPEYCPSCGVHIPDPDAR